MGEHEHIKDELADYAVGGLSRRRRERVDRHLRECVECRRELSALERTGALLESVPLEDAPDRTWDAVRREVYEQGLRRVRPGIQWAYRAAVGAVAAAVILIGVLVLWPGLTGEHATLSAETAEHELQATMQGHLSAAWAAPLSDEAAMGLQLVSWEEDG
jgi:anti-sigma factor RsiW